MNTPLAVLAALITALALYLPTRTQPFTFVTVDGRTIRLLVSGSGDATVVFENGSNATLEMWGKVQPEVSRFARTVSYDRAGSGLSDDAPLPREGRSIAADLHRALQATGIAPPYVLVGASLGGPYARIFTELYPDDVAGLVLVDPTPDHNPHFVRFGDMRIPSGVPVFLIDAISPVDVPFATAAIRKQRADNRAEIEADTVEYTRWLGTVPGGRLITTHHSGHNVAVEQPELVVDTIRQAVDAAGRR